MNNKRILTKEQYKILDKIFNNIGETARLSYIYASLIIQNFIFIIYHRVITMEQINKWFLTSYLTKCDLKNVSFSYENIARIYLKEKFNIDYDKYKNAILYKINYAELKCKMIDTPFKNFEDYCQYIVNNGLQNKKFLDDVYRFVVDKNNKENNEKF